MSTSCGSDRSRNERVHSWSAVYPVIRHNASFTRSTRSDTSTRAMPIGACVNAFSKALRMANTPVPG